MKFITTSFIRTFRLRFGEKIKNSVFQVVKSRNERKHELFHFCFTKVIKINVIKINGPVIYIVYLKEINFSEFLPKS